MKSDKIFARKLKVKLSEIADEPATGLCYVARKFQELTGEKVYDMESDMVEYDYKRLRKIREANKNNCFLNPYYDALVILLGICPYCEIDLSICGLVKKAIDCEIIRFSKEKIKYSETVIPYYCQNCNKEILIPSLDSRELIYLHEYCKTEN